MFSQTQRKKSYKGSIKRTRSIQIDNLDAPYIRGIRIKPFFLIAFLSILRITATLGYSEHPSLVSSRTESPVQSTSPDTDHTQSVFIEPRSPSPDKEEPWEVYPRRRTHSDAQYEHTDVSRFSPIRLTE